MPSWRNIPSMPKVRDSSGTMGTMCLPIFLSRSKVCRICTNAIVVEISRSSVLFRTRSSAASPGTERCGLHAARRQKAAELHAPGLHVFGLRRSGRKLDVRDFVELVVRHRNLEAIAKVPD